MSTSQTTTQLEGATEELHDGGYYAIKGFLYQFDLTIEEILTQPTHRIEFESIQDINYEEYVIQVKHKETQDYQPSKVRKPIIQLIKIFEQNNSKKLYLYCHFKNRTPEDTILTSEELDTILGKEKDTIPSHLKEEFVQNFTLRFSEDYESRFTNLIGLIMTTYNLAEQSMAILYHSIIQSKLLSLSIQSKESRNINKKELDALISKKEKIVFYEGYRKYLENENYEKFVKKEYFTHKTAHIMPFERLFIIDGCEVTNETLLLEIIISLSKKYYRLGASPAPYICFKNIDPSIIIGTKQQLVTKDFGFTDGTLFNGDYFRIDKLTVPATKENGVKIKFIDEEKLIELFNTRKIDELYEFFTLHNSTFEFPNKHIKINIKDINQILKIIK
ncbi:hypothetical protein SIM13_20095 [Bacillus cereus group sp. BfR-BA-01233]|uniref:hypothetical protein n=1 Tax=Bacillus cereus group sp. BfR-BA-01233 TaxID=3094879 RepID=UPI000C28BA98|nr:hypothetical protein [Bacillus cereus group sp. BfR-BA-01233]MDX5845332.1 hypothetical protein [Bacillus cereus group sp. BfR-BA-01233]